MYESDFETFWKWDISHASYKALLYIFLGMLSGVFEKYIKYQSLKRFASKTRAWYFQAYLNYVHSCKLWNNWKKYYVNPIHKTFGRWDKRRVL